MNSSSSSIFHFPAETLFFALKSFLKLLSWNTFSAPSMKGRQRFPYLPQARFSPVYGPGVGTLENFMPTEDSAIRSGKELSKNTHAEWRQPSFPKILMQRQIEGKLKETTQFLIARHFSREEITLAWTASRYFNCWVSTNTNFWRLNTANLPRVCTVRDMLCPRCWTKLPNLQNIFRVPQNRSFLCTQYPGRNSPKTLENTWAVDRPHNRTLHRPPLQITRTFGEEKKMGHVGSTFDGQQYHEQRVALMRTMQAQPKQWDRKGWDCTYINLRY